VPVYKDKLMIMKRKDKIDICLMSITHDENLVQTRVQGQYIKKLRVVVNYYLKMGGVDMSDAELVSYHSTKKRLKMYYQKHCCYMMTSIASILISWQNYWVGVPVPTYRELDLGVPQK
jgi:hypothetical protein